jgi:hypothetical protein
MHRLTNVLEPDVGALLSLQWILVVLRFTCLVCHFGWMVKPQTVLWWESWVLLIVMTAEVYIGSNALQVCACPFCE